MVYDIPPGKTNPTSEAHAHEFAEPLLVAQ